MAEQVLGVDASQLQREVKLAALESALAAPFASFGGEVFYPDPVERAAVLCSRLVRNHAFTDGNKRVAYAAMRMTLAEQDADFYAPDKAEAAEMVERLAAREVSEADFAEWVRSRCR